MADHTKTLSTDTYGNSPRERTEPIKLSAALTYFSFAQLSRRTTQKVQALFGWLRAFLLQLIINTRVVHRDIQTVRNVHIELQQN
jgi:hypothetical protein